MSLGSFSCIGSSMISSFSIFTGIPILQILIGLPTLCLCVLVFCVLVYLCGKFTKFYLLIFLLIFKYFSYHIFNFQLLVICFFFTTSFSYECNIFSFLPKNVSCNFCLNILFSSSPCLCFLCILFPNYSFGFFLTWQRCSANAFMFKLEVLQSSLCSNETCSSTAFYAQMRLAPPQRSRSQSLENKSPVSAQKWSEAPRIRKDE